MTLTTNGDGNLYKVEASGLVIQEIKQLFREAETLGIGAEVLRHFRQLYSRLQQEPFLVGEPVYTLPNLKLQVRIVVLHPISVTFAVHEEKPLVFIKIVTLLSHPDA